MWLRPARQSQYVPLMVDGEPAAWRALCQEGGCLGRLEVRAGAAFTQQRAGMFEQAPQPAETSLAQRLVKHTGTLFASKAET